MTRLLLLTGRRRAAGAQEVLPVEVFIHEVGRPLLPGRRVPMGGPAVLLQVQPAVQVDAGKTHTHMHANKFTNTCMSEQQQSDDDGGDDEDGDVGDDDDDEEGGC